MKSIVLIMGGTGVGTSSIAMRLSIAASVPVRSVIGTDSLREVVRQFVLPADAPEMGYSSYDGYLAYGDSALLITAYKQQTTLIGRGVAAIIRRAVQENIGLIIEGVHLSPDIIREQLGREYLRHVSEVLIDIESPGIHRERIEKRSEYAPLRDTRRQLANFGRIRQLCAYLREVAQLHHIPIISNDSTTVEDAVKKCIEALRL